MTLERGDRTFAVQYAPARDDDGAIIGCAVIARIVTAQPVIHAVAPDGVEKLVHAVAIERQQLRHGANALCVEPHLGARSDSGEVA